MIKKPDLAGGQIPLPFSPEDKAAFDNFWIGHNSELVKALQTAVVTNQPKLIYYYGSAGAGKSHLMYATIKLAEQQGNPSSYLGLSNPSVSAMMLDQIDSNHLVCIDDVDRWAGDESNERALFALFEQIKHAAGQLIVSATAAPNAAGFKIADLISRFSSGLLYPLHSLSDEQQFEAIKMRARYRGLSISDDAVRFLLRRSSRDATELFNTLDQIDKASLIEKRRITIPFLQTILDL